MKLRQKSYVLTVALVAAVLFVSTFVLVLQNLRATFCTIESRAIGEEKALAGANAGAEPRRIRARLCAV